MPKIDIAGLKIDALTKQALLDEILKRVKAGQKTWVTTPYSEFLYAALKDAAVLEMLNQADFALADGIGIFWAKKFLDIPLTAKSYYGKILQAFWQAFYSLPAILFYPKYILNAIAPSLNSPSRAGVEKVRGEKISGSDLIWDLTKMAAENNLSIYLLGGFGDTPKIVAEKLSKLSTSLSTSTLIPRGREGLALTEKTEKIVGWSNKNPNDPTIHEDIKKTRPDMLFVAYGPIRQERWIAQSIHNLPIKLAVGLGGTFDYIAGKRPQPPKFMRRAGLEWLWRLFTQPHRIKRIWQATFGLVHKLVRYKIFMSYPYRPNAVSIILNSENKILICRRNPENPDDKQVGFEKKDMLNYWQFPQGGIGVGESVEQAIRRECEEELGITNLTLLKISEKKHSYLYPNAQRPLLMKQSLFKGQSQFIAYLKFSGRDDEIKVDNIEFNDYKWVELEKPEEQVHPHRRAVAKIAQEDLEKMREKAII